MGWEWAIDGLLMGFVGYSWAIRGLCGLSIGFMGYSWALWAIDGPDPLNLWYLSND